MPYNSQQSLSPYYNDRPRIADGSILSSNNNSSNGNFAKLSTPATTLHYHQEQRMKLSPGTFSLSPLPSPSLTLYGNSIPPAVKAAASVSEPVYTQDDDALQPLDLSIHPNRNEQTLKRTIMEEHKPICMIKSCTCSSGIQHISPYITSEQETARSPNPGTTLSPLNSADSSSYAQQQTPSSAYHSGFSKNTASYLGYLSQLPPWTTTESSSFQHLTTSDNVLNGVHNSSNLFRPYDDRDVNLTSQETKQRETPLTSSKQHNVDAFDSEDEPIYMDLDSTTTTSLITKSRMDYIGRSEIVQGKRDISFTHNMNTEGKVEATYSSRQSTLLQVLNSQKDCDSSQTKNTTCYVGGVISHTSFEKCQKRAPYPTAAFLNSEPASHLKQQLSQPQICPPNSSSPPSGAALSTSQSTCYSVSPKIPQTTWSQTQCTNGHTYSYSTTDGPNYSMTPVLEPQPLSPSAGQVHPDQLSRESPVDKKSIYGNKNRNIRSKSSTAANYFQLPVSSSPSTNEIIGNKHGRSGEIKSEHLPNPDHNDNENSTKISLLDYWISKILMERSSEAPQASKPCNVDYICTANGEKRIRLRLVDLMELQVEQSLKA